MRRLKNIDSDRIGAGVILPGTPGCAPRFKGIPMGQSDLFVSKLKAAEVDAIPNVGGPNFAGENTSFSTNTSRRMLG